MTKPSRRLQFCRLQSSSRAGFTLIEIAIVLAVIGILLIVVLQGRGLIGTSHSQAVVAAVKDLSTAIAQFRERYGYLPGDMPTATTQVPGVVAGSCSASANGNGDGQIDADELACVTNHLFNAGLIKGGTGAITYYASDRMISIRAIGRAASAVTTFPTSTPGPGRENRRREFRQREHARHGRHLRGRRRKRSGSHYCGWSINSLTGGGSRVPPR